MVGAFEAKKGMNEAGVVNANLADSFINGTAIDGNSLWYSDSFIVIPANAVVYVDTNALIYAVEAVQPYDLATTGLAGSALEESAPDW